MRRTLCGVQGPGRLFPQEGQIPRLQGCRGDSRLRWDPWCLGRMEPCDSEELLSRGPRPAQATLLGGPAARVLSVLLGDGQGGHWDPAPNSEKVAGGHSYVGTSSARPRVAEVRGPSPTSTEVPPMSACLSPGKTAWGGDGATPDSLGWMPR